MINPRSIEEVKDILLAMASRIDLWDGTWEQNSYTEPLSSDDGFWYGLTYKKRFGEYEVSIGCEGEDDNYVTFIAGGTFPTVNPRVMTFSPSGRMLRMC